MPTNRPSLLVEKFDLRTALERYAAEFAKAGIAVGAQEPAVVAAQVRASPIREQLAAAVDDWAWVAFFLGQDQTCVRLLQIGRLTAPDPIWGDRLRQIDVWRRQAALRTVVQDAPARGLSPALIHLIVRLVETDEVLWQWLRRAQSQYPNDFWLNFYLGDVIARAQPADAVGYYRAALAIRPEAPYGSAVLNNMGIVLNRQGRLPEAAAVLQKAVALDPRHTKVYNNLGGVLRRQHRLPEALAALQKAIDLDPQYAIAYANLGNVLYDQHRYADAIAAYNKAIVLDPQYAPANSHLGGVLLEQHKLPEARAALDKAIKLDPGYPPAYSNRGRLMQQQRKLAEAVADYRKAIDLDPQFVTAYNNLASALIDQGKCAEAAAQCRKAIQIDPQYAYAYTNLGHALTELRQLADAKAALEKAIALDPKDAIAHYDLGNVFLDLNQYPEAQAAFQKTIDLNPRFAPAYNNLGEALRLQQRLPEALAVVEQAIVLNPNYGMAHGSRGYILLGQGRFGEAAEEFQKGRDLLPATHTRRGTYQVQLKQARRLQSLDERLPAVLQGKDAAGADTLLAMARLCQDYHRRFAAAVRLYQDAFHAQPASAGDTMKPHRYRAAIAAALAGTGQGSDAAKLPLEDRAKLRAQAAVWLQAGLADARAALKSGKADAIVPVEQQLSRRQQDANLAGVRDPAALARLPAMEAKPWMQLWADVAAVLQDARGRYSDARLEATLSRQETTRTHPWNMVAGRTYVIDLESRAFDTFLKLDDPHGKRLAENDDIAADNLNSRLIYTAPADGVYRLVAASFQVGDTGSYTLRIREFK